MDKWKELGDQWIAKAVGKYGGRFDYSKVVYLGSDTPVEIVCPDHGPLWMTPEGHLYSKYGCRACAHNTSAKKRSLNNEDFIESARRIHGNKYSYPDSYKGMNNIICIVCDVHGKFPTTPSIHIHSKCGCPDCGVTKAGFSRRLTHDQFLEKSRSVHGDRYDYSIAKYTKNDDRIRIICKKHKYAFWQLPSSHMQGVGCRKCGLEAISKKNTKTSIKFIEEAKRVHGGRYTYEDTVYSGSQKYIKVTCSSHGQFRIKAESHLNGRGCKTCHKNQYIHPNKIDTKGFIARSRKIHKTRYDYRSTVYRYNNVRVSIRCRKHGDFTQTPNSHLNGRGCPRCARERVSKMRQSTTEKFIGKAIGVHGERYDYSKVTYVRSAHRVTIICKTHGEFTQIAGNHLNGRHCGKCSKTHSSHKLRLTNKEFLERVYATHGSRYDVTGTVYTSLKDPVKVRCKDHGYFQIEAASLIAGSNCPLCREGGFNHGAPAILYYLRVKSRNGPLYKIGITNRSVMERWCHSEDRRIIKVVFTARFALGKDAWEEERRIKQQHAELRYDGEPVLTNGNSELFTTNLLTVDPQLKVLFDANKMTHRTDEVTQ